MSGASRLSAGTGAALPRAIKRISKLIGAADSALAPLALKQAYEEFWTELESILLRRGNLHASIVAAVRSPAGRRLLSIFQALCNR